MALLFFYWHAEPQERYSQRHYIDWRLIPSHISAARLCIVQEPSHLEERCIAPSRHGEELSFVNGTDSIDHSLYHNPNALCWSKHDLPLVAACLLWPSCSISKYDLP